MGYHIPGNLVVVLSNLRANTSLRERRGYNLPREGLIGFNWICGFSLLLTRLTLLMEKIPIKNFITINGADTPEFTQNS